MREKIEYKLRSRFAGDSFYVMKKVFYCLTFFRLMKAKLITILIEVLNISHKDRCVVPKNFNKRAINYHELILQFGGIKTKYK